MTYWIQISSGRGPAECCWVAARTAEQILAEAGAQNIKAQVIRTVPGPGKETFKSILISVEAGVGVKVFLSQWQGTVKWIGKSRYRPEHKRKNWFVSVDVFSPVSAKTWHIGEIKFETMRSSGPGGQHANKTESALRARHLPSGLSAVASEERSQHLNKRLAMARLDQRMKRKNDEGRKQKEQQQWDHHNNLVRGNARRIFKGQAFHPSTDH